MAKKSIYSYFPTKACLADYVYKKTTETFLSLVKEGSQSELFPVLVSYSDLLVLLDERTFNRYSQDTLLRKEYGTLALSLRQSFLGYWKEKDRKGLFRNASFFPSLEATLREMGFSSDREEEIRSYSELLEEIEK
jgi:hypothetical protein